MTALAALIIGLLTALVLGLLAWLGMFFVTPEDL
jgi:hypothetical protein